MKTIQKQVVVIFNILIIAILLQGCAVKYVADYDAKIEADTIQISKKVNKFYANLLETDISKRVYESSKKEYIEIEVEIRALILQSNAHPLNSQSIFISEMILEKWLKYKNNHKLNNTYKDALIVNHQKRFERLFKAMLIAEIAKDMRKE